jgi:hypothetical protein
MSFDLKLKSGNLSISNGDLETVSGSDKLIQDILKVCLTEVGSNVIFPWYGSYVSKTMIGSTLDPSITLDYAKTQLTNSINTLKSLQETQSTYQNVSADELIYALSGVSITRNKYDPTLFSVMVRVMAKNFKLSTATFNI